MLQQYACMHHFETFLHSTRHAHTTDDTTHAEWECPNPHPGARMPARCSAHMYTSTHAQARDAYTHTHVI